MRLGQCHCLLSLWWVDCSPLWVEATLLVQTWEWGSPRVPMETGDLAWFNIHLLGILLPMQFPVWSKISVLWNLGLMIHGGLSWQTFHVHLKNKNILLLGVVFCKHQFGQDGYILISYLIVPSITERAVVRFPATMKNRQFLPSVVCFCSTVLKWCY